MIAAGRARRDNQDPREDPGLRNGPDPRNGSPQRGLRGLRGLTWDHPRGYVVLDALNAGPAALNAGPVHWERQSLEGFESRPLRDLADDFDLLIIDHPGLGEAVRDHALRPLEEIFSDAELPACEAVSADRSFASYRFGGSQWALPVDAAAQVSVSRPDLMADLPATWDEVCRAARRHRTAVCLGGRTHS